MHCQYMAVLAAEHVNAGAKCCWSTGSGTMSPPGAQLRKFHESMNPATCPGTAGAMVAKPRGSSTKYVSSPQRGSRLQNAKALRTSPLRPQPKSSQVHSSWTLCLTETLRGPQLARSAPGHLQDDVLQMGSQLSLRLRTVEGKPSVRYNARPQLGLHRKSSNACYYHRPL